MVKRVTQMDLARAEARGAEVKRIPQLVEIPELEKLFEHFHDMKHEKMQAWERNHAAKMAKLDELIKAVQGIKLEGQAVDLGPLMKMITEMQRDHRKIAAEHAALMAVEKEEHSGEREPCTYKLTGRRQNNGLIDLEYGLTFTPVNE